MKISEAWLREWVNPPLDSEALCYRLTFSGLEVESATQVAEPFLNVVVGKVLSVEKHPDADRLIICQVNTGEKESLTIVCGAKNVKPNMNVPVALVGATLPNGTKITRSKIRNVYSNGMLCSAVELGLPAEIEGILELPQDAPIGQDLWQYFHLSDRILEIAVTPNRGDCLSILGMAEEVEAETDCALNPVSFDAIKPSHADQLSITINAEEDCPRYVGRMIRKIKSDVMTPIWMQERLRRSGIRCISAAVDVMNYVMIELGQPMHAFDLNKIEGSIVVRHSQQGERLTLLDGQTIELDQGALMIADEKKSLAIGGIMGGLDSAVTLLTEDVFLESAFFTTTSIARSIKKYNLNSESSYRFERGVDPTLQTKAIERATHLLLSITGGEPGPIVDVVHEKYLPSSITIPLRPERVTNLLGINIAESEIESILKRLGFFVVKDKLPWQVTVPARRFDLSLEIDLVEEIIRLYGYDKLPSTPGFAKLKINDMSENQVDAFLLRHALRDFGYHETITYSFIDKSIQQLFDPNHSPKELLNPITSEMSVMRTMLWPGLVNTLRYNQNRQQSRVRLFEIGLRFMPSTSDDENILQQNVLSGLISGMAYPLQWSTSAREVDFYDLKGDLENVLKLMHVFAEVQFKKGDHPALHPGQTAILYRNGNYLGIFGALHPNILQELQISGRVYVFELLLDQLIDAQKMLFSEISKFPEIRRDIAVFVDQTVPVQQIRDTIYQVGGELLKEVTLFDVYQGKGVPEHRKSIALALTLQHDCRTLVDEEVADIIERVVAELRSKFAAELRG